MPLESYKHDLEDYRRDMDMCCRCSCCKFIPLEMIKGYKHVNICPSIAKYNFHAYSGGGRLNIGMAILENRIKYTNTLLHVIYNCQMCGGCDISCKYVMDMEVLEVLYAIRFKIVEDGQTHPAIEKIIKILRKNGTMLNRENDREEQWSDGLCLKDFTKEKVQIAYHVGCRTRYDKEMWGVALSTVTLLKKAGVDFGIAENELCCGGRAYQMGYREDFFRQAKRFIKQMEDSGIKIVLLSCSDCYYTLKVLYEKFGLKGNLKVVHTTEFFDNLIKEGKLRPNKTMKANVTYHDPCHLGRLGEPYINWEGKEIPGHIRIFEPPREFRRGTYGVYEPPRDILRNIPGLKIFEMDRKKEYAWCCGAGGGVRESNPEFSEWTAKERIEEARSTGANAIVTACPGCERNFKDVIKKYNINFDVYDVMELLNKAV